MRGGIFLGKMPLGVNLPVKSRIETAVVLRTGEPLLGVWIALRRRDGWKAQAVRENFEGGLELGPGCPRCLVLELFSSIYRVAEFLPGGLFLRKKPLSGDVSDYPNWRTAIGGSCRMAWGSSPISLN